MPAAGGGRRGEKGWWINRQAPWGTKRFDTREKRLLEPGENSSSGPGGTILVEDPEILPHWIASSRWFLTGASYKVIGEKLYEQGLRGPQGGVLGHRHVRNFLTNRHLISEVKTRDDKAEAVWRPAQWGPHVNVDLFRKVQKEVERREGDPRNKKRTSKGTLVLRPVCAHCEIEYHGGRSRKDQGNERTYVHPTPHKALHPEIYDAFVQHGCRAWT